MLSVDIDECGVATVTLDRPDVRDALNIDLVGEVLDALRSLSASVSSG